MVYGRLRLTSGDITAANVDAIVNSANSGLGLGAGLTAAVHLAAGPDLLEECLSLGGCETGDVKSTAGYNLPARYIFHTVGPIWRRGPGDDAVKLESCYRRCMELAHELGVKTIAFPSISTGIYGYPMLEAAPIAIRTVLAQLDRFPDIQEARFVLRSNTLATYKRILRGIIENK